MTKKAAWLPAGQFFQNMIRNVYSFFIPGIPVSVFFFFQHLQSEVVVSSVQSFFYKSCIELFMLVQFVQHAHFDRHGVVISKKLKFIKLNTFICSIFLWKKWCLIQLCADLIWRIYAKRRNSHGHLKCIKKHKITPNSCCLSAMILCSIFFELFSVDLYLQLPLW